MLAKTDPIILSRASQKREPDHKESDPSISMNTNTETPKKHHLTISSKPLSTFDIRKHITDEEKRGRTCFFLGDSLTDWGNFHQHFHGFLSTSQNYPEGRFSDGPVWTDYACATVKDNGVSFINLASAGATSRDYRKLSWNPRYWIVSNLSHQIKALEKAVKSQKVTPDLITIWIGSNDYLYGWDSDSDVKHVVKEIERMTAALMQKYKCPIIWMDLPDLGKLPYSIEAGRAVQLNWASKEHNKQLIYSRDILNFRLSAVSNSRVSICTVSQVLERINYQVQTGITDPLFQSPINSMGSIYPNLRKVWLPTDKQMLAIKDECKPIFRLDPASKQAASSDSKLTQHHPFYDTYHPSKLLHYCIAIYFVAYLFNIHPEVLPNWVNRITHRKNTNNLPHGHLQVVNSRLHV